VEYAFTDNWIGRAEYRFYDFSDKDLDGAGGLGSVSLDSQTLTVGNRLQILIGARRVPVLIAPAGQVSAIGPGHNVLCRQPRSPNRLSRSRMTMSWFVIAEAAAEDVTPPGCSALASMPMRMRIEWCFGISRSAC